MFSFHIFDGAKVRIIFETTKRIYKIFLKKEDFFEEGGGSRGVRSEECGVRLHSGVRDYTRWCGGAGVRGCEITLGGEIILGVRGRGGTGARDYSGGGGSALRVISSPPESGGEPGRAGWSEQGLLPLANNGTQERAHRPPRDSP